MSSLRSRKFPSSPPSEGRPGPPPLPAPSFHSTPLCPPAVVFPRSHCLAPRPAAPSQVKAALDVLAQKVTTFTDVGNSLAHVQHLLKDLASFEEKSSVSVDAGGGTTGTAGTPCPQYHRPTLPTPRPPPARPSPPRRPRPQGAPSALRS